MIFREPATACVKSDAEQAAKIRSELETADAVIIGAGSGLSASAGLTYSGRRFEKHFSDFIEQYHFSDMYSAGFYPYPSREEYWAYWSRQIYYNRYDLTPGQVYFDLYGLVREKNYFIITTNVDHQFQLAGFDKTRLFYTQGDYGLWQCGVPCHQKTYDNEETVRRMVAEQAHMRVPSALVPHCPVCGAPMTMNLRCDPSFVQDAGWEAACGRYKDFLQGHSGLHILFLELGVGGNTPAIIKYPFWNMTARNSRAVYATINKKDAVCPPQISRQSICMRTDITGAIADIKRMEQSRKP